VVAVESGAAAGPPLGAVTAAIPPLAGDVPVERWRPQRGDGVVDAIREKAANLCSGGMWAAVSSASVPAGRRKVRAE
jgi:hypothetical protein